jgi:hypothetical protein
MGLQKRLEAGIERLADALFPSGQRILVRTVRGDCHGQLRLVA